MELFDIDKIIKEFEQKTEPEKMLALRKYEVARKYMAISIREIAGDLQIEPVRLQQYMKARIEQRRWIGVKQIDPHTRYTQIAKSILRRIQDKIKKAIKSVKAI
jgi:hypothetical protein